ncbi:unnamed protein product, partial [Ilex paraguariensis]
AEEGPNGESGERRKKQHNDAHTKSKDEKSVTCERYVDTKKNQTMEKLAILHAFMTRQRVD